MGACKGTEMWAEGPKCAGGVRMVLVPREQLGSSGTGRLMARQLERVFFCHAHEEYARAHGVEVIELDDAG
jgi:hypothetical protein